MFTVEGKRKPMALEGVVPLADFGVTKGVSRFKFAPPRRFTLPAILLLLSEEASYGYALVSRLRGFGFGPVDRPAVYRALAILEGDALVESSSEGRAAAQAKKVYRLTPQGAEVLRQWMGVMKEEHQHLGQVLHRYQSGGTAGALLAEVEGQWPALGSAWLAGTTSPSFSRHRLGALRDHSSANSDGSATSGGGRFHFDPDRSVVLIEVRSTAGPLSFGALGVRGSLRATVSCGVVRTDEPVEARIEVDVDTLKSGNRLHDGELMRMIDSRRFPRAVVTLSGCEAALSGGWYRLRGDLSFHGVTKEVDGGVDVSAMPGGRLLVSGEQVFDIRDFSIPSPTALMFRIYPDVRVRLQVEAVPGEAP